MRIKIKPHHFIDIITSLANEKIELKPCSYRHDVHTVTRLLLQDSEIELEMELGADKICAPCIHNKNGLCDDTIDTSARPRAPSSKREWNLLIDQRWCSRLQIKQDDVFSAQDFCLLIKKYTNNLQEIYPEMPLGHTEQRARDLNTGLEKYLYSKNAIKLQ
ncbi:MAG: hypothetical protein A2096_13070 [Spirochaetes bacterium GWF1_41_5]|nr:MAG: hypothetical protein A2096_13070 [Spirochaetes bacterium GWF1_41_5]